MAWQTESSPADDRWRREIGVMVERRAGLKRSGVARPARRCWIVSAASGAAGERASGHILQCFPEDDVMVAETRQQLRRCVRESASALTMIAGGDGAWREAMEAAGENQPIGFLPAGTLNQARLELGIPASVAAWRQWRTRNAYLGLAANGEKTTAFFLMLGAGVEAEAVAMVRPGVKDVFGRLAYLIAILERLLRPVRSGLRIEIGGRSWRTCQVIVHNGRYYGGPFVIAPKAGVFRAGYRVLIWKRSGRLGWCLGMAARMFRLPCRWLVEDVAAESLAIHSILPATAQVDGDTGSRLPLTILPACPRRVAVPEQR